MKMLSVTLGTQTGTHTHTHKASVLDCVCGSITDKARKNKLIKSTQHSSYISFNGKHHCDVAAP